MLIRILVTLSVLIVSVNSACDRDRNVKFTDPLYLNYGDGFFYIQGLTNGEAVVIYKHPEDERIFGQYTFKDEKCSYETVYYFVLKGKYEFTNPYVSDESNFNITNKLSFVKNGVGYEIEYSLSPRGVGIFQNLGAGAEKQILPKASFKKTPVPSRPLRELFPNFANIGKQNLKVSYLRNGENFIQFIGHRNQFSSIEGSYTFRTSDRRYHTVVYEIPLNDFDYVGMAVKEYEVATEENYFRSGKIVLNVNGTAMDVKFFVDKSGFHIADLQSFNTGINTLEQQQRPGVQRPFGPNFQARSPVINSNRIPNQQIPNQQSPLIPNIPQRQSRQNGNVAANQQRFLNPTFSRPDLLTAGR